METKKDVIVKTILRNFNINEEHASNIAEAMLSGKLTSINLPGGGKLEVH